MKPSIPKLTLVWKSKGMSIGALKWQKKKKNTLVPVVGTFQCSEKSLISAKHHGPRPKHGRMSPTILQREREKERKNHWLSCDHVTFGIAYYLYCKTLLIHQVKIQVIRNVFLSCRTLTEQVTRNPRFYCIWLHCLQICPDLGWEDESQWGEAISPMIKYLYQSHWEFWSIYFSQYLWIPQCVPNTVPDSEDEEKEDGK